MLLPKRRGDARLMAGLAPSSTPVSVCPLLPRSMKGMASIFLVDWMENANTTHYTLTSAIWYSRSRSLSWTCETCKMSQREREREREREQLRQLSQSLMISQHKMNGKFLSKINNYIIVKENNLLK